MDIESVIIYNVLWVLCWLLMAWVFGIIWAWRKHFAIALLVITIVAFVTLTFIFLLSTSSNEWEYEPYGLIGPFIAGWFSDNFFNKGKVFYEKHKGE